MQLLAFCWVILWMIPALIPVDGDADHFLKMAYCRSIKNSRVYKLEELDVHCAGKVNVFEDMVSVFYHF